MGNDSPPHLSPNWQIKMPKCKLRSEMGLLYTHQAGEVGRREDKEDQRADGAQLGAGDTEAHVASHGRTVRHRGTSRPSTSAAGTSFS